MLEDLITIISLRKKHLSRADAYFRRCRHYIAAGHKSICVVGCRICDGSKRYSELLHFYSLRDSASRPERKCSKIEFLMLKTVFSIRCYLEGNCS